VVKIRQQEDRQLACKTGNWPTDSCVKSIFLNEQVLWKVVCDQTAEVRDDFQTNVRNPQFWADCVKLLKLLEPLTTAIDKLESRTATIADCYRERMCLTTAIE